jgi:CheY-like chemotaxis protein
MKNPNRLLVVENEPQDLKRAAETAKLVGFSEVEARTTPQAARTYLEKGLEGKLELPDTILLDLDFGVESGYELLRFWHSTPKLRSIPLVVWSVLGAEQRDMCNLFKVNSYVGKWEGEPMLQQALTNILQSTTEAT